MDDWNRVKELLRRTKKTTKSRYRASERLERHHKYSQWSVALLSCALIFIPLVQVFQVHTGISNEILALIQAVLAVLVLVYSLLLGQENFISRSNDMHKNGVELGRYARKLAGLNGSEVQDAEYNQLVEEYYNILEKYENHKPVDYLFTQLSYKPKTAIDWPLYLYTGLKAYVSSLLIFSHYFIIMLVASGIFIHLVSAMITSNK